jgi:hypothetical protein
MSTKLTARPVGELLNREPIASGRDYQQVEGGALDKEAFIYMLTSRRSSYLITGRDERYGTLDQALAVLQEEDDKH